MKIALRTKIFYVLMCASLIAALAIGAQPLTSAKAAGPEACNVTNITWVAAPGASTYKTLPDPVFTVQVNGPPGVITGTVIFYDDPDGAGALPGVAVSTAIPLAEATPAAYQASTTLAGLKVVAHNLYAVYSGDANYCASNSIPGGYVAHVVAPRVLTVGGTPIVDPASRVYDRTPNVTFTGGTVVGVIAPDVVTLATQVGTTNPPDAFGRVGVAKPVTPAFTLGGADAGNYTLTQPAGPFSITITAKPLVVTGITASNKVYDNNPVATINTTGAVFAVGGVILPDSVTLTTGTPLRGYFVTAYAACDGTLGYPAPDTLVPPTRNDGVADGKTVVICGYVLGGVDALNYSLTDPSTTANITKAPITLAPTNKGLIANNKPYDGNNDVLGWNLAFPIALGAGDGVIDPVVPNVPWGWTDSLGLGITALDGIGARFSSANAGTWPVTATGFGFTAGNTGDYYLVAQPAPLANATINKATANIFLFNAGAHAYTATPWVADLRATNPVTGVPVPGVFNDVRYNGSSTPPTNVGVYAVTIASFTPTDTANYNANVPVLPATTIAMGNLTITKANPQLFITNSPTPWNGAAQAVALEARNPFPPNLVVPGVFGNVRYNGSATVPSEVGTYQITGLFTPTDTANYNNVPEGVIGTFVIAKANPVLSVTNSPVNYDGTPKAATVSANVAGVVSSVLTGGAATQTNAGTYAVTANFAPTDTVHYNSLTAAAAGNFVINKATLLPANVTLVVTNSPVAYDGDPHAATVAITYSSVPGSIANILTGGALTQTLEGIYPVTADFFPTDAANYNTLLGVSAGNFEISHVSADLITNGGFNQYDAGTKIPTSWSPVKFGATDGKATARHEGLFSVRLLGVAGQRKTLSQEILVAGAAGDTLTFKAWIKGSSIPSGGVCRIQVYLYDGSVLQSVRAVQCPTGTFNWTQMTKVFTSSQAYTRIKVQITYFKDSGYVWFDGLSLIK